MGCFGYICKECGTAIRGNEKCTLIHVRHGAELGRAIGHYDTYGGVLEDDDKRETEEVFCGEGDGINGHRSICRSEFELSDSYSRFKKMRIFEGNPIKIEKYISIKISSKLKENKYDYRKDQNVFDVLERFFEMYPAYRQQYSDYYDNYLGDEKLGFRIDFLIDFLTSLLYDGNEVFAEYEEEFNKLPKCTNSSYSGIVAYHSKCYYKAMKKKTFNLIPSDADPDQGCGKPRNKYL